MNAGRELDALVAEKVIGWTNLRFIGERLLGEIDGEPSEKVPFYSIDLDAAWEIAEKMGLSLIPVRWFKNYDAWNHGSDEHDATWWGAISYESAMPAEDRPPLADYVDSPEETLRRSDVWPTAPLAICHAALAAVGAEIPASA